jgi:hypothetical protein
MMKTRSGHATLLRVSLVLTVALATITHLYEYRVGVQALVVGAVLLVLLTSLDLAYRHTGRRGLLIPYGLLAAFVILGFGVANGLWNHVVKLSLFHLHNGQLPSLLGGLFPPATSAALEAVGALTFVTALLAAHHLIGLVRGAGEDANHEQFA